jgi:predicted DCC family thiol-disulfide oxidoreductase YuxK
MAAYPLTVFFDGACPVCVREIALMRRLDRRRRLVWCDFSRPDYDTASINISPAELGRVIHARWADGNVITGVEVFRAMWEAVGLGFLARLSRLWLVEPLVLRAYAWFARNRLRLTGRSHACTGDSCRSSLSSRHNL